MGTPAACPRCNTPAAESDRFCRSCGSPLIQGSFCPSCGVEASLGDDSCASCGAALHPAAAAVVRYRFTPARIVVMSLLTSGLFLLYWLYITWKQYRDLTGEEVYPLWHALSCVLPIYGYFRVHAHVRVYKELMVARGIETTLNPAGAVLALVVITLLGFASFSTANLAAEAVLSLVSSIVTAGLILLVQENLNSLWDHVPSVAREPVGTTPGQVALAVIGVMGYLSLLAGV